MSDRTVELASHLLANPWMAGEIKKVCADLLKKWEGEDLEKRYEEQYEQEMAQANEIAARQKATTP